MEKYDVIIIGGGAAGLSCALTLGSTENKFGWAKNRKYLVIDDDGSDLLQARLFNVPGVKQGITGRELIEDMKNQLKAFKSVSFLQDKVVKLEGELNDFTVSTESGKNFKADRVVLATGMQEFSIECKDAIIEPHDKVMKPNKIKIKNVDFKIKEGLYVAGLAAGSKTMFAIAAGDGVRVACDIFEEWTGKYAVAHDSIREK